MADGFEIAKAYVTIIPSFKDGQSTIAKELGAVTESASKEAGEKSGKTFGESLATGLKTTAGVIAGAMAVATGAAVATGKAFINSAKDTAAYGDEVDKTSQKVGLSAKAYQEWDYVMKIAGTEMSSMTTGLKTLTNKLDDAKNGSESAQAMFSALGISMDDIATMSREDLFEKTIAGLQGMEESTERAALANDLFGKSGQNLAPLFNMSAEETQQLIDKANEYGMVLSDEGVKASAEFTDSMTTMQNTMTGLKNNMMSKFLPSLTKVTDGIAGVISGKGDKNAIKEGIKGLIGNVTTLAPTFLALASAIILGLLDGFAPMLPQAVSSIFSFLNDALVTLTGLIPQLTPVIVSGIQGILTALFSSLPLIIDGLTTLLVDLVSWLADGNNVTMFVNGIVELVSKLASSMAVVLPVLIPAIVTIISELALALTDPENVGMLLNATLDIVEAIFMALVNCVPELIDFVAGIFENLGELLGRFFDWVVPIVSDTVGKIFDKIKTWGSNIKDFFSGLWQNLKDGVAKNLDNLKSKFTSIFDNVRDKVKSAIDKIKSFFNFSWSLPKLKVPHFTITGSFSLSPPSVPKIGVSWYAKAMDEPFLLDGATIFGAMNGRLLGGGERGSELIVGTNKLMEMIAEATGAQGVTINVYGAEGQDVSELAKQVAYEFEEMKNRKAAVYG